MRHFLFCMLELLVYVYGVTGLCALLVEQCHRATYALLRPRAGRIFWYITALPGVPVHELGHAAMCLLFFHRIERIRLWPSARANACVEHSYSRRNPYAAYGNIWIGLGPILSGIAVILLVLRVAFPSALTVYGESIAHLQLPDAPPAGTVLQMLWDMLRALFTETRAHPLLQVLGVYLLLSMSQHVRLSVADLRGMAPGIPWAVLLAAITAAVITLLGETALASTTAALQAFALLQCALFALVLLISAFCLGAAVIYRIMVTIAHL